jgi:hypothetical protein
MDDYRQSLRPLTILYSVIARRFGRPDSIPGVVNNEVRNAWDHLAIALEHDDAEAVTRNGQQALWHLLIARCNLLRLSSDIVRTSLEATISRGQGDQIDPRIPEAMRACAARGQALREEMAQAGHPLPQDDPDGNLRKMTALTILLNDYLEIYRDLMRSGGTPPAAARSVVRFTDEQSRVAVNLRQHYNTWIDVERHLLALPHDMRWETMHGSEMLCKLRDAGSDPALVGPRSPATEAVLDQYRADKARLTARRLEAARRLDETSRLYRVLRLPLIASEAAAILRELDRRTLLGEHLLVVGTSAVPVYALEAGGFLADAPDETQDFDLAWRSLQPPEGETPVWSALKAVDPTYTVNTEMGFQALNAGGYAVDLLVAPSRVAGLVRRDRPRPVPMETQEWLLRGRVVDHVVVARDGSPARIVAPDPRWFGLHKLWLSAQDARNPLKRDKDGRQGTAVLNAVDEAMPHYRLDAGFQAALPPALATVFQTWRASRPVSQVLPAW